jgi:hypothetical protein
VGLFAPVATDMRRPGALLGGAGGAGTGAGRGGGGGSGGGAASSSSSEWVAFQPFDAGAFVSATAPLPAAKYVAVRCALQPHNTILSAAAPARALAEVAARAFPKYRHNTQPVENFAAYWIARGDLDVGRLDSRASKSGGHRGASGGGGGGARQQPATALREEDFMHPLSREIARKMPFVDWNPLPCTGVASHHTFAQARARLPRATCWLASCAVWVVLTRTLVLLASAHSHFNIYVPPFIRPPHTYLSLAALAGQGAVVWQLHRRGRNGRAPHPAVAHPRRQPLGDRGRASTFLRQGEVSAVDECLRPLVRAPRLR